MELRELFEKLHPVPVQIEFDGPNGPGYYPKKQYYGDWSKRLAWDHNIMWGTFQSGHAAGLEDAAEEVQKHFIRGESLAGLFSSIAAAIRAMKEPK